MEIELITLPRLRTKQLQSVAEKSIDACKPLQELQPAIAQLTEKLTLLKAGMVKQEASASEKANLDKKRDKLISGLFYQIKSEAYFPHENAEEKLQSLQSFQKKYGFAINRLPLDEQTATVDNMLAEAETLKLDNFAGGRIQHWFPLILEANNDFRAASGEYVSEKVNAQGTDSASDVAPQLVEALELLIKSAFGLALLSGTPESKKAYQELEVIINSFR